MSIDRPCKDCTREGITTPRPAPYPGPRCATHHRAVKVVRRKAAHDSRVENIYGITGAEYDALYEFQGGHCAICEQATGRTKRLAVDHDHSIVGPDSVRGLLCGPCNRDVIGRLDLYALNRAIRYLIDPPARKMRRR